MPVFAAVICVMFSRWIVPSRLESWFALLVLSVVPHGTRVTVSIPPERSRPKNPLRAAS